MLGGSGFDSLQTPATSFCTRPAYSLWVPWLNRADWGAVSAPRPCMRLTWPLGAKMAEQHRTVGQPFTAVWVTLHAPEVLSVELCCSCRASLETSACHCIPCVAPSLVALWLFSAVQGPSCAAVTYLHILV